MGIVYLWHVSYTVLCQSLGIVYLWHVSYNVLSQPLGIVYLWHVSYNVLSQPLGIVYLWQAMLCEVGITSINTFFLAQIPVEITSMHITRYPVIALKTVKVAIGFS